MKTYWYAGGVLFQRLRGKVVVVANLAILGWLFDFLLRKGPIVS